MNKLQSSGLICLAIAAMIFSSCSKTPDNAQLIPKETRLVSVVDIYSLAKKSKFQEINDLNLFKALEKEIKNESKAASKILQGFIENPASSGIDFKSDLFIYYLDEKESKGYVGISVALGSEKKFTESFRKLAEKTHKDFELLEVGKIKLVVFNDYACGWDSDKLLILSALSYDERSLLDVKMKELFALKKNEQIFENKEFKSFYAKKKDWSIWFSSNILESAEQGVAGMFKSMYGFDLKDNYIAAFMDFRKDNIVLRTHFTPNKEFGKMMKENEIFQGNFDTKLLSYFPEKKYIVGASSIKPEHYFNFLKKGYRMAQMQPMIEKELGFALEDLFKSLKGNFLLSLFEVKKEHLSYMTWGESFDENQATALRKKRISKVGDLSEEDIDRLNRGETIKLRGEINNYSINIKNVLAKGGNVETAMAQNSRINCYEGGWNYGKNVLKEKDELIPQIAFATDLNSDEFVKKLIEKIPEKERTAHEGYTEISLGKISLFAGINKDVLFLTNNENQIKKFASGEKIADNLGNTKFASEIKKSPFYSFLNLNYKSYSEDLKNEVEEGMDVKKKAAFDIFFELSENVEMKYIDDRSAELIYNLKKSGSNSLHTILTTIDAHYQELMAL